MMKKDLTFLVRMVEKIVEIETSTFPVTTSAMGLLLAGQTETTTCKNNDNSK